MEFPELTTVAQDYLKIVWASQEWSDEPVTTKMLAGRLGVSPSTASESIRRLTEQGLLDHAPYSSITLTDLGERLALSIVRRHRLLETFLVEQLGYSWDEAHDDAEILEHAASDRFVGAIDGALGYPIRDPHGDPIPKADGTVSKPGALLLSGVDQGGSGFVARISDADPEMLRYFSSVGLILDARIEVEERRDFAGVIRIRVENAEPLELGTVAAEAIWVVPERKSAA